jgi:hypothetical protein
MVRARRGFKLAVTSGNDPTAGRDWGGESSPGAALRSSPRLKSKAPAGLVGRHCGFAICPSGLVPQLAEGILSIPFGHNSVLRGAGRMPAVRRGSAWWVTAGRAPGNHHAVSLVPAAVTMPHKHKKRPGDRPGRFCFRLPTPFVNPNIPSRPFGIYTLDILEHLCYHEPVTWPRAIHACSLITEYPPSKGTLCVFDDLCGEKEGRIRHHYPMTGQTGGTGGLHTNTASKGCKPEVSEVCTPILPRKDANRRDRRFAHLLYKPFSLLTQQVSGAPTPPARAASSEPCSRGAPVETSGQAAQDHGSDSKFPK